MEKDPFEKVEDTFHSQIWGVANDWMRCQRAVAEGRDLAYAILRYAEGDENETLRWMAQSWLDNFGRSSFTENMATARERAAAEGS